MHELMIIGGGPSGLSAAVYAARKKLDTLLISGDIGGQVNLTLDVENYLGYQFIGGPELIAKFQEQVAKFPIDQEIGKKVSQLQEIQGGFEAATETGDNYQAKAVVYAAGKRPRKLGVPGEDKFIGRGVSYCAICDGPVFSGQRVVVVGGGNSALEAALDMVKIAEHVDLVSLTPLTGDAILASKLKEAKNLSTFINYQVERIEGDNFVSGAVIKNLQGGDPRRLEVTGVFIEIGMEPNSEPVAGLMKLNKWREVPVSSANETTMNGLFAAGDVTDVPEKQIVVAAGEGAKAALQAHRYLQRLTS
jgi:alkyl hydroperoxide reductase subunit F